MSASTDLVQVGLLAAAELTAELVAIYSSAERAELTLDEARKRVETAFASKAVWDKQDENRLAERIREAAGD